MKASPRQQQLLLDLQDLDTAAARLRRQREQIPERAAFSALDGDYQQSKDAFMSAQRELDAQRAELDRIESDVKLVSDRQQRDNELIAVSTSSKEAQALQSELETLARRQSELEDRQLEAMEIVESAQAAFDAAQLVLAGVDQRRAEFSGKIAEIEEMIDANIARTGRERAGLAAELQRDLLDLYEETRARTGLGAARLRGNVSEGSNMALAPGELAGIRTAAPDEVVFCPGSGAILVRTEES